MQPSDPPARGPFRPPEADRPFRSGLWVGLALLLVLVAASLIRSTGTVLTIVAAAGFFAIGLNPVVKWIMRRGVSRGFAVTILFLVFLLITCGFLALLIPLAVSQLSQVIAAVPGWVQQFLDDPRVQDVAHNEQLAQKVAGLLTPQNISLVLGGLLGGAATVAAAIANVVTAAILMFFILGAFDRLREGAYQLVPISRRKRFTLIAGSTALLYLWITGIPYEAVQISNLAAIVSVLIGFAAFGVIGVFVSVPGYDALQLIIRQVLHPHQDAT